MAVTIDTFYSEQYLEGARPSIPSNPIGVIEPVLNPPGVPIGHSPVTIGTPANGLSINDTSQVLSLSFPISSGQVAFGTGAGVIGGKTTFSTAASTLTIGINANNGIAENAVLNIIGSTDNVLFPTNHARSAIINFTSNNQTGGVSNSYLSSIQNTISGNLEFIVNSVTKLHISRVNDRIGVLTVSPTDTIDVNGTTRIRTIDNLGSTPAEVLVPSATGVVSKRTLAEFASDLGIGPISGLTTNRIPKATSATTIGDSRLFDDGTSAYFSNQNSNTFFGLSAGGGSDLANRSQTAFGYQAGRINSSGVCWTALGHQAAYSSTTILGFWTAIGKSAGFSNITGDSWVAIGASAGEFNTSGSNWVAIGYNSALSYSGTSTAATEFSNGVYIGQLTKVGSSGVVNEIVIGYQAEGVGSNTVVLGNTSIIKTVLRGTINAANLPTSSAGLLTGDIWNDAGTLKIV